MAHPRIINKKFPEGTRLIEISDVHAHLGLLDALLEKIRFSPESDFIIFIGDTVENGENSLGALRRAMDLEKSGCAITMAGNWDYFMHLWFISDDPDENADLLRRSIELNDYYGSSLLCDMCTELGIELTAESDMAEIMPIIRSHFGAEIQFMGNMPIMLDAGDFVCVHGGVNRLDADYILGISDEHSLLKNDAFAEQGVSFDRWVITGHWPVANYDSDIPRYSPHFFPAQRIAAIDGGCGKLQGAQLNALIMHAGRPGEFAWDFVDEFPRVRALEKQAASEAPIHTTWNTRFIDVISKGAEYAQIVHLATGKLLDVPLNRLWTQGDTEVIGDYTDYALPVEPGDVLSVLFKTSRGIYCKKADISGWYYGKYEKIGGK